MINIDIPSAYPFEPPKMKFVTKIWHPNISSQTGAICLVSRAESSRAEPSRVRPSLSTSVRATIFRHCHGRVSVGPFMLFVHACFQCRTPEAERSLSATCSNPHDRHMFLKPTKDAPYSPQHPRTIRVAGAMSAASTCTKGSSS